MGRRSETTIMEGIQPKQHTAELKFRNGKAQPKGAAQPGTVLREPICTPHMYNRNGGKKGCVSERSDRERKGSVPRGKGSAQKGK